MSKVSYLVAHSKTLSMIRRIVGLRGHSTRSYTHRIKIVKSHIQ